MKIIKSRGFEMDVEIKKLNEEEVEVHIKNGAIMISDAYKMIEDDLKQYQILHLYHVNYMDTYFRRIDMWSVLHPLDL